MNAGTIALVGFIGLVALSAILDAWPKFLRARADSRLLSSELRYSRADVELAVEAAVSRSTFAATAAPDADHGIREGVTPAVRRFIAEGILEDLDGGHLTRTAGAGAEAA